MAKVIIPDEDRTLTDTADIRTFLEPFGIWYEHWPVEERLAQDATNEEILEEFAPEIEQLKQRGKFVTADVINVNSETPNLDAMLAKFDKEHTHVRRRGEIYGRGTGAVPHQSRQRPCVRRGSGIGRFDQRA